MELQPHRPTKSLKPDRAGPAAAGMPISRALSIYIISVLSLLGVIGMTGLLLDTELDSEQHHFVGTIKTSGESLLCLINDMLDFSEIEAGKLTLEKLDFDLTDVISETMDIVAVRAEEKGLELVYRIGKVVPSLLHGDPTRLRQILINLVNNSIKFTSKGQVSVRVATERESDARIVLRIEVIDSGIGIPQERISDLFEEFTQVDACTTRVFGARDSVSRSASSSRA